MNSILLDINSFLVPGKLKAEGIYDSFFDAKLTIPYATSCPSKLLNSINILSQSLSFPSRNNTKLL